MTTNTTREWVAILHGQHGTIKIAYRNAAALAAGLAGQTSEGWMVARVYARGTATEVAALEDGDAAAVRRR